MDTKGFLEFHKQCTAKMFSICERKNNDYTGASNDPFKNFRVVGAMGLSVEQGFLTRMSDKMARLATFCQGKKLLVMDESVEDTLLDLANYCILLNGYIKEQKSVGENANGKSV